MDYKNDNRTPRDRITGEFLSELLFTELGGECDCNDNTVRSAEGCGCRNSNTDRTDRSSRQTAARVTADTCPTRRQSECVRRRESADNGCDVEITGNYSLAMAYVPMQAFGDLFDIEEGFCEGTIFKRLRFPFNPTPCRKEGN